MINLRGRLCGQSALFTLVFCLGTTPPSRAGAAEPRHADVTIARGAADVVPQKLVATAIDPALAQQIRIAAIGGQGGDQFGARVAISGDTAVVGANKATVNGKTAQGAAYIFVRSGATWVQQAQLLASDGAAGDQFGAAVAIDRDTVVVGARFADFSYGNAYIYTRSGSPAVWAEQKLPRNLYPGSGQSLGQFGFAVSISGSTVVVGSPRANGINNVPTGTAHIFVRNGTSWTFATQLSGQTASGFFGQSVGVSANTIVVGDPSAYFDAPNDPNHPFGVNKGAAYVYTGTDANWTLQQQLSAPDGDQDDFFGNAVAIDGDSVLVGAPGDDIDGRVDQGSISIWARSGNTWSQQFAITGTDSAAGDNFGSDVAIRGSTALVGAIFHAVNGHAYQGAGYLFGRSGVLWSQTAELLANGGTSSDRFGVAVGLTDRTAIAGAFGAQGLTGAAYLFEQLDSDGDGLPDSWETNGVTVGSSGAVTVGNTGDGAFIDLPKMGADRMHKDIFIHADWMGHDPADPQTNFVPDPRAIKIVTDAFAQAPVTNPDNTTGITLHFDFGPLTIMKQVGGADIPWGTLSEAGEIPFQAVIQPDVESTDWPDVDAIKDAHFAPAGRSPVFHYVLYCNSYGKAEAPDAGGVTRSTPGTDSLIGLMGWRSKRTRAVMEAGIFMHEFGHNLGLDHGGHDIGGVIPDKPNYLSVMNYLFTPIGILGHDRRRSIDYSRETLPTLDETFLDENKGIDDQALHLTAWSKDSRSDVPPGSNVCIQEPDFYYRRFLPGPALDWNCDGQQNVTPVVADVNGDGVCVAPESPDAPLRAIPAGDDQVKEVVRGAQRVRVITPGVNRECETAKACDPQDPNHCDIQVMKLGQIEPKLLPGFNDWPALMFDGGGVIGLSKPAAAMRRNAQILASTTASRPRELSITEILAKAAPALLAEQDAAPLDVVTASPQTGPPPLKVDFDGTGSTSSSATIVDWAWDFGDGSTGSGSTVAHAYNAVGTYFARLTVTDSNGHINLIPLLTRITVASGPTPTPTPNPSPTPVQGRYSFTKVIDSEQVFVDRTYHFLQGPPLIAPNSRTLVFGAQVYNPDGNLIDLGLYTIAEGGQPITVANAAARLVSDGFGGYPFINASGAVAWNGGGFQNAAIPYGIYVTAAGAMTTIASNAAGQPFLDFQNSHTFINSSGTVAFRARLRGGDGGSGIFTGNGGAVTTVADSATYFNVGQPAINDAGTVVFAAWNAESVKSIFMWRDGVVTTLVDTTGDFYAFGDPSINSAGDVAFFAYRDDGSRGVFRLSGGVLTTVADTSGPYLDFTELGVSINDRGTVVFGAALKGTGDPGIYTGPDPVLDKVVAAGDSLFGDTISTLAFHRSGLNNNNEVGFVYRLANKVNGRFVEGLALAAPRTVLANISTRAQIDTGDNALIGGFIITGTEPKKVIMRGIGPSLPVANKLQDPVLELRNDAGDLIESNDNWGDAPNRQEIVDSLIPPSDASESAILRSLTPGAYTAILRGANQATGLGLVELYDLNLTVNSQLANISTRGRVQTDDRAMIGGFIISGSAPQKVIVRAIGPSLPVDGQLQDPALELYNGNGDLLGANNDWGTDQPAEIIASTVAPQNDREAAIVRTLPPGAYTAIVRGVDNTTGVALVEVYTLNQ